MAERRSVWTRGKRAKNGAGRWKVFVRPYHPDYPVVSGLTASRAKELAEAIARQGDFLLFGKPI